MQMLQVLLAAALAPPLAVAAGAAPAGSWPQFGFDARHSGVNDRETAIHRGNVGTLHLLYAVALPEIADGAPAFLPRVRTPQGVKDLLFLTTKNGILVALDAASGGTVWSVQPAAGPNFTTSSPAIDPGGGFVYSYGLDGKVHRYRVGDGAEIRGSGWPQLATAKPELEKGSSALAVAATPAGSSFLYVANGGYPNDAGDYQGHVTTIDLASGAQRVFNTMCSGRALHFVAGGAPNCPHVQGAVWARPGVVYDPATDRIFLATGNGLFDAASGGHEWGDSILALRPDGRGPGGGPLDSYTPPNFEDLGEVDLDLGSSAPAILPAPSGSSVTHLGAHCGKDSRIRLLDLDDLSGQGGPGHVGGELQGLPLPQGDQVLSQPAVWVDPTDRSTWLFIASFAGISGLQVVLDPAGRPSLVPRWTNHVAGTSPIVANGILFYGAVGVGLQALDPTTGDHLWVDPGLGPLHWQSPIVVQGRAFMSDQTATLRAYGPQASDERFQPLPPCRAIDTRGPPGPHGAPALASGPPRPFPLAGRCGIPAGARAVAATLTVIHPSSPGDLRVGPAGAAADPTLEFTDRRTRANLPHLSLTGYPLGAIAVTADLPAGETAGLLLDVHGYYE